MAYHTSVTSIRMLQKTYRTRWNIDVLINDPGLVYIGMPGRAAFAAGLPDEAIGPFGKPWACLQDPRGWQVAYREYLWNRLKSDPDFALAVRDLHGKTLVCWCKGKRPEHGGDDHCHGDILSKAAEWLYHGIRKEAVPE